MWPTFMLLETDQRTAATRTNKKGIVINDISNSFVQQKGKTSTQQDFWKS
jgi:hypothetical protein